MKNLKLGLLALLTCASISVFAADDSLQIHGYVMNASDFSAEESRTNVSLHRDPNFDPRGKLGDLGNSYWHDYFTAFTLNKKWDGKDGAWADFTYELVSYGNKSVEAGQSYARFGGLSFLPEGSEVWAGRRIFSKRDGVFAYNLKDIGVDAGIGYTSKKFDITLGFNQNLRAETVGLFSGPNEVGPPLIINGNSRNVLDFTYKLGTAELGVTYVDENNDGKYALAGNPGTPRTGVSVYGAYNMDKFLGVMPGNTMVMVQFGKGVIAQYLNTSRIDYSADEDTSMRLTVNGRYDGIKDISIKPSVILESTDRDATGSKVETGVFAGANITQKINDKVAMHYEANINNTQNKDGVDSLDGTAYKIAAGPSLQIETFEWVRPMVTLNVAVVGGDKEITGLREDSEVRFGYQMEAWF